MDIRITKLVVPARSRNGRIYTGDVTLSTNGGSGGGSTPVPAYVSIPPLRLKGLNFRPANGSFAIRDKLLAKWQAEDTAFLSYNPEIWIFRRNAYRRRKWIVAEEENEVHINKKWKHEPHLNGVKFPGSRYYAGTITSAIASVEASGRHTEFELTAAKDVFQEVPLNIYEFLRTTDGLGNILTDASDFSAISGIRFCSTNKRLELRFAIVIDNPDTAADNPKLIGPLSDIIILTSNPVIEGGTYVGWRFVYANYDMWVRV